MAAGPASLGAQELNADSPSPLQAHRQGETVPPNSSSERNSEGSLLPRGRHALTAEEVAANQRRRTIAAIAECVATEGYAATTVDRIIGTAGISRGTFYAYFENRRDCLIVAHRAIFDQLLRRLRSACVEHDDWADRAAAAITVSVEFALEFPYEARLISIDATVADPVVSRHALDSLERLSELLRSGRGQGARATSLPAITEPALISAAAGTIHRTLVDGKPAPDLGPELVHLILAPYLGAEEARRVAQRRPADATRR